MFRFTFLSLSLSLLATGAAADQDWCRQLYEDLPADIFEHAEIERIAYDQPELGFAISYGYDLPEALTVYFYDGGNEELSESIAEQQFFKGAQDMLVVNKSRAYQPLGQPEFRRIDTGASSSPVFRMRLVSETTDFYVINDYLVVFGWGDCLTKVRLTNTDPELAMAEASIDGIVDRLRQSLPSAN